MLTLQKPNGMTLADAKFIRGFLTLTLRSNQTWISSYPLTLQNTRMRRYMSWVIAQAVLWLHFLVYPSLNKGGLSKFLLLALLEQAILPFMTISKSSPPICSTIESYMREMQFPMYVGIKLAPSLRPGFLPCEPRDLVT